METRPEDVLAEIERLQRRALSWTEPASWARQQRSSGVFARPPGIPAVIRRRSVDGAAQTTPLQRQRQRGKGQGSDVSLRATCDVRRSDVGPVHWRGWLLRRLGPQRWRGGWEEWRTGPCQPPLSHLPAPPAAVRACRHATARGACLFSMVQRIGVGYWTLAYLGSLRVRRKPQETFCEPPRR